MIKFTKYKNDRDTFIGFKCEGHANYAEYGRDIVCSAITATCVGMFLHMTKRGSLSGQYVVQPGYIKYLPNTYYTEYPSNDISDLKALFSIIEFITHTPQAIGLIEVEEVILYDEM